MSKTTIGKKGLGWRRAGVVAATAIAMFVVGCASPYTYLPTAATPATAKAVNCDFTIATTKLPRPYIEVGILDLTDVPRAAPTAGAFRDTVRSQVCAAGGDAVIADVNGFGNYVRGTIVRWQPAKRAAQAATTTPAL